ncbi:MAG: S-layer protein, partial [Candidatus Aenigmatarchaeota archaeon]
TASLWHTEDGSDNDVHFLNNATLLEDEFVVVTDHNAYADGEYSYILEFKDWSGSSGEEEATFEDVSTGTEYIVTANDYGTDVAIGSLDVEVTGFDTTAETVTFNNTGGPANEVAALLTKNGASLIFNVNTTCGPQCATTDDIISTTDAVFVWEENDGAFDVETEVTPQQFSLSVSESSGDVEVETNLTELADDDGSSAYFLTEAGTYIKGTNWDEEKTITMYIPDEATPVFVAFGISPSFSAGEGVAAGTVQQAVQIKNSISKMESEVNTATLNRDLVLLGGPCANGLVAELLEMSATSPACATEFTADYPTEGVIKIVEDAFDSGYKALIVAGVDRAATRDLAVKVMQGTLDYAA